MIFGKCTEGTITADTTMKIATQKRQKTFGSFLKRKPITT